MKKPRILLSVILTVCTMALIIGVVYVLFPNSQAAHYVAVAISILLGYPLLGDAMFRFLVSRRQDLWERIVNDPFFTPDGPLYAPIYNLDRQAMVLCCKFGQSKRRRYISTVLSESIILPFIQCHENFTRNDYQLLLFSEEKLPENVFMDVIRGANDRFVDGTLVAYAQSDSGRLITKKIAEKLIARGGSGQKSLQRCWYLDRSVINYLLFRGDPDILQGIPGLYVESITKIARKSYPEDEQLQDSVKAVLA